MTKEEKIIEAYGQFYELVKEYINEWGYIKHSVLLTVTLNMKKGDYEYYYEGNEAFYRPKSLKGIENNNGWIKIETEEHLPKENGLYWVIREYSDNIEICAYTNSFTNYDGYKVTHYQPIVKPKPPVY